MRHSNADYFSEEEYFESFEDIDVSDDIQKATGTLDKIAEKCSNIRSEVNKSKSSKRLINLELDLIFGEITILRRYLDAKAR